MLLSADNVAVGVIFLRLDPKPTEGNRRLSIDFSALWIRPL